MSRTSMGYADPRRREHQPKTVRWKGAMTSSCVTTTDGGPVRSRPMTS